MKKKLYLNNVISLIYQLTSIAIGLILPRLLLDNYGSAINGYVSSITKMLGFISIMDLGVGSVVQAALYKPLSERNKKQISTIYNASRKYFRIIAYILIIYIIVLCIYYSIDNANDFSALFSITLVLVISLSSFAQYYFGISNSLLLNADQRIYIVTSINLITLVLNAIISIILMLNNVNIQFVKLAASMVYVCRPILLSIYVKKNYKIAIDHNISLGVLKNKWSGMAQHISTVLTGSIDYIVLTIFSTLTSISVYSVYVLPLNSIRDMISAVCSGYKSFFGKLIAENNMELLNREFDRFETIIHCVVVFIYTCSAKLLVSFVILYTNGVNDANYINYLFAYLISFAYALFALRTPYTTVIFAAGHFKETQKYCIVESVLNIVISVALVIKFDIVGVAIGTCVSVLYRLIVSEKYLHKNILNRNVRKFLKHIIADLLSIIFFWEIGQFIIINEVSIFSWCIYAIKISIVMILIVFIIHCVLFSEFRNMIKEHRIKNY